MKVAVGADHKGFEFKQKVKEILARLGYKAVDFGTHSTEAVDYPDFGFKVAEAVVKGEVDYGITVCWTGNGMNIAVNKVKGIRAGMALSVDMARYTRLHNDANIMTLAAKYTPEDKLEEIIKVFLQTKFEGGRHIPRVEKIRQAEKSTPSA